MGCCGGGCFWWKNKPDPAAPPIHPPDNTPPIHPPDPSMPSGLLPVETGEEPSSSNKPLSPMHPSDPSMPSGHPPVETGEETSSSKKPFSPVHSSMPSRHSTVESSSSEKPDSTEVLKSFEKADIAKADEFIEAIKELLERATTQKDSTSSSNTDKLSNWASFTQSGATFLKFVSDHTEKIHPKGDFFQSGEVKNIVGNMLKQFGQLHWAAAGLSIVGYVVLKCQKVSENRAGCLDLLKVMIDLASHIKNLNILTLEKEIKEKNFLTLEKEMKEKLEKQIKEKLENAFQYIVEGSIYCAFQLDSGNFFSFLKSSINSDTLSVIRSKIDQIYQDLQLTTIIKMLEQQQEIVELQQEMSTQQQEILALQPLALPPSQPGYPKNAVGIEEQLEAVNTLLNMKKMEDCSSSAVVIWGFGGIGKTTLARAVVSKIDIKSYNYASIDLDEVSEKNNYIAIQQQILKDAFPSYMGGREIKLRNESDGRDKLIEAFKCETNKPVFLFIDNALHVKDLEKILPEDLGSLPQRSRILITTRILSVTDMLQDRGLQRKDHQVKTLSDDHAAEILCNDPVIRNRIKDDLEKMVELCNGIPLVLKMVGAHLRKQKYNVHRCTQIVGALQSGGTIKEEDLSNRLFDFVYKKLEVSTQEAFLDICCFFDKDFPRQIVEYIVGAEEVTSLQEAALISTVMGESNYSRKSRSYGDREEEEELVSVHDIIRSIGRSLSKSSRIMDLNSWREAEKDEGKLKGIKGVWLEGIRVWLEDKDEDCRLEKRHLDPMKDTLRILVWTCGINVSAKDAVRFPELRYMKIAGDVSWVNVEALDKLGVLECEKLPTKQRGPLKLPENLRYISVRNQPAVPCDLVPNSPLEELHLDFSETSESSDEEFDLYVSETSESPDLELDLFFSETSKPSNEERDDSENAFNGFLHGLNKLKTLIVDRCYSLCELPQQVCRFPQLSRVCITNCSNMERLPQLFGQLETLTHLKLSRCKSLKELPESFGQIKALTDLNLSLCESLKELPESFGQLKALTHLDLSYCESLKELPESFGQLKALTDLLMSCCLSLKELPKSFGQLKALTDLDLQCCKSLKELPESFGQLKALTHLNLRQCESLKELPESFGQLKALTHLELSDWGSLKELPELFGQLKALTHLVLLFCESLKELPESFGQLKALTDLKLSCCKSLKELPKSFGQLKALTHLELSDLGSLKELPESFGQLKALTHLALSYCKSLKELPESFGQLKALTDLNLQCCKSLKELPESFGQLKALTHLNLRQCESLKELPESFGQLKALTHLDLYCCSSLKELPYTFDQLEALQWLDLKGLSKLESDICLMDDNIKIVQKSEHSCTDCWKDKKLKIES